LADTEAGEADPYNVTGIYVPERRGLIEEFLTPLAQTGVEDYLPSGVSEFARALATYTPLDAGVYALSSAIFQVH
jgi:hypothetical protein